MDKLAKQLREDAEKINVTVSDELDRRIEASLHAVTPATEREVPRARPPLFWLASTLTGVAAALAIIAILNVTEQQQPAIEPTTMADLYPGLDLNMRNAVTVSPLEEELENLQKDLKRAEEKVKEDIGL